MTTPTTDARERSVYWTVEDERIQPEPNSGCWLWVGKIDYKGYGRVTFAGKYTGAHRAFWMTLRGPIPEGMVMDHICRSRSCVNPDHLRVVTVGENSTQNSVGPTAINLTKKCCPKCGGPYRVRLNGYRFCLPCKAQNERERAAFLRAQRKETSDG